MHNILDEIPGTLNNQTRSMPDDTYVITYEIRDHTRQFYTMHVSFGQRWSTDIRRTYQFVSRRDAARHMDKLRATSDSETRKFFHVRKFNPAMLGR